MNEFERGEVQRTFVNLYKQTNTQQSIMSDVAFLKSCLGQYPDWPKKVSPAVANFGAPSVF